MALPILSAIGLSITKDLSMITTKKILDIYKKSLFSNRNIEIPPEVYLQLYLTLTMAFGKKG